MYDNYDDEIAQIQREITECMEYGENMQRRRMKVGSSGAHKVFKLICNYRLRLASSGKVMKTTSVLLE